MRSCSKAAPFTPLPRPAAYCVLVKCHCVLHACAAATTTTTTTYNNNNYYYYYYYYHYDSSYSKS